MFNRKKSSNTSTKKLKSREKSSNRIISSVVITVLLRIHLHSSPLFFANLLHTQHDRLTDSKSRPLSSSLSLSLDPYLFFVLFLCVHPKQDAKSTSFHAHFRPPLDDHSPSPPSLPLLTIWLLALRLCSSGDRFTRSLLTFLCRFNCDLQLQPQIELLVPANQGPFGPHRIEMLLYFVRLSLSLSLCLFERYA
jgi:hypothetical protein